MSELELLQRHQPNTVLPGDFTIPKEGAEVKSIEDYLFTNQLTQVFVSFVYKSSLHLAIDRLKNIKNSDFYDEYDVSNEIFNNARQVLFKLMPFLDFLEPEEIGPSPYGTILFNFEKDSISLVIDIGETTSGYIFSDKSDRFIQKSSDFNDELYWEELLQRLSTEFKDD